MSRRPTGPAVMLVVVFAGLLAGLVLLHAGVKLRRVTSGSMRPTYDIGDWIVTREDDGFAVDDFDRGDVVVFRYPFGSNLVAVKRVDGLPGDTIDAPVGTAELIGDSGGGTAGTPTTMVAPRHLFVTGDNAGASIDSRSFGPLPEDQVVGRVLFRLPVVPIVATALIGALALLVDAPRRRRRAARRKAPSELERGTIAEP